MPLVLSAKSTAARSFDDKRIAGLHVYRGGASEIFAAAIVALNPVMADGTGFAARLSEGGNLPVARENCGGHRFREL